jgi:threonine dehydratase
MVKMGRNPSFAGVEIAHKKVRDKLPPTPLRPLQIGESTIWCKCESAQPVGAFKIRGAWHRLTDLDADERARGVVAFSSGNHAQGVAWAARELGIAATIVMPSDAPRIKLDGTRALGAEVIPYDRMTAHREVIAARIAAERGATLVPSFDDPWVIEGQGTAGLEVLAQIDAAPDVVVTPCGGGGLAAGLALALPNAQIITAEPEGWDDMGVSLRAGVIHPVGPNPPPTICDSIQTMRVASSTFEVLKGRNARGVSVSETAVCDAMRLAYHELGLTIEPGGAVGLAALLSGKIRTGARTLVMLSGGNVDPDLFDAIIKG